MAMSSTPENTTPENNDQDDHALSPKKQRKVSNIMIGGVLAVIAAVLIFVIASAFLNGA